MSSLAIWVDRGNSSGHLSSLERSLWRGGKVVKGQKQEAKGLEWPRRDGGGLEKMEPALTSGGAPVESNPGAASWERKAEEGAAAAGSDASGDEPHHVTAAGAADEAAAVAEGAAVAEVEAAAAVEVEAAAAVAEGAGAAVEVEAAAAVAEGAGAALVEEEKIVLTPNRSMPTLPALQETRSERMARRQASASAP